MSKQSMTHPGNSDYYVGKVHGGEGKENIKFKSDSHLPQHRPTPNVLNTVSGPKDNKPKGHVSDQFDPLAQGYRGPGRFIPTNVGVRNPHDLEKKVPNK